MRWGVKRVIIREMLRELRREMAPIIRRLSEGVSREIDLLISDLYEGKLTYAGFAELRLAYLHDYETRIKVIIGKFAPEDQRRDRYLQELALL